MTRRDQIIQAMNALHAAGVQPSPGKIQNFLNEPVTHNINGRDAKVYAEEMERLGYKRVRRAEHSWQFRWVKDPTK